MNQSLRILVADDHEMMRDGVRRLLAKLCDNAEIVEAASYDEVIAYAQTDAKRTHKPDIILLDLHMPGMPNGQWVLGLQKTCEAFAGTPTVVMSGMQDSATVATALRSGARGFLPKTTRGKTMLAALRLVLDGETYVPPSLVDSVDSHLREIPPPIGEANANDGPAGNALPSLSAREQTVLRLLIRGKSNKEIARDLGVEEVTIKVHLRAVYRKLGATNRVEAVRIALERGLTPADA